MKKVLLLGTTALVIGGILYYPTYRAPKAHEIIEQQLSSLNSKLTAEKIGGLKVQKHETDKDGSQVELEVELAIPEKYRTSDTPESIVLSSVLNIDFGFLPSAKGFKSIHSTTVSPDINGALAELGNTQGFTLTCDTAPASKGYDSNCTTNSLSLRNDKSSPDAQEVEEISFSESKINVLTNNGMDQLTFDWVIPNFKILDKTNALADVNNIKLASSLPIDPEGKISLKDSLMGKAVIEGKNNSSLTIDSIKLNPPNSKEQVEITNTTITSESEVKDGLMSAQMKFNMPTMKGMPMDLKSFTYDASVDKVKADFLVAFQEAYEDYQQRMNTYQTTGEMPADKQQEKMLEQGAAFIAAGPSVGLNIDLEQNSGDALTLKTDLKLKESSVPEAKKIIEHLSSARMAANENLAFFLKHGQFQLDAKADNAIAEMLSATIVSGSQPSADSAAQKQAALQGLAMLEMFGVIARNDKGFTAQFEANDKGVYVNGKDFSPMLGLPPQPGAVPQQAAPVQQAPAAQQQTP